MREVRLNIIVPAVLLVLLMVGCDNDNNNNAMAQPSPMSGTSVTGTVNAPTEQTCPKEILIDGLKADDVVVVEINSTGNMSADAVITNSTANTSASCSGGSDATLPPAEANGCKVSSSTIAGLKAGDEIMIGVFFSNQGKEVVLEAPGSSGLTCAFITIETINASN